MTGKVKTTALQRRRIAKDLGVFVLPQTMMGELQQLGIEVDKLGAIRVADGALYVTAQALLKCVMHISQGVNTPATAKSSGRVLSELAKSMHKLTTGIKQRPPEPSERRPPGTVPSFPAGLPVNLTQINHYHKTSDQAK